MPVPHCVRCHLCNETLEITASRLDGDGDLLVFVKPCPVCLAAQIRYRRSQPEETGPKTRWLGDLIRDEAGTVVRLLVIFAAMLAVCVTLPVTWSLMMRHQLQPQDYHDNPSNGTWDGSDILDVASAAKEE